QTKGARHEACASHVGTDGGGGRVDRGVLVEQVVNLHDDDDRSWGEHQFVVNDRGRQSDVGFNEYHYRLGRRRGAGSRGERDGLGGIWFVLSPAGTKIA